MKFLVDTADVAEIKDQAASGLPRKMLDEGRKLAKPTKIHNGLKAFLDDWAKTGQSIL